ncbi:phosphate ABC transporter substrate-binding protein PstS [Streptomyces alkaliphilus]|uniref:Phosphate-binding protein n=1 Tax=Streptomyces alkaliphilus TaxID=1472722 RepID=A0A7W3TC29_9ACTN|nr:phosphate ABC transporter substrate-binding protein PstS [Streptomyces alkaliphilus]MBB0244124.1 phosphate ABC transporter substrate-binding protein PstS [Streptomyces alkaliphilus]
MRNWRAKTAAVAVVSALALVTACGSDDNGSSDNGNGGGNDNAGNSSEEGADGSGLSGTITGAGASFPDPLFQEWIAEYTQNVEPDVTINYQSVGSGAGVEQFLGQSVEFGSSEEYLSDEALAEAESGRCEAVQFPVVFGAVVIAFNDPALDGLVLDAETIAKIYDREITNYNDDAIADLNPDFDLPDQEILPVHRSDSSGTTFVFTNFLSHEVSDWESKYGAKKEIEWAEGTLGGDGNQGVAQGVQQSPGGIGYVNQSFALEAGLPVAHVVNEDGEAIAPTLEATSAASEEAEVPENFQFTINDIGGEGYPIAGTNWIFTYTCDYDENTADIIKGFWTWAMESDRADELAEELGYAPLGAELKERVLVEIEKTNSGS